MDVNRRQFVLLTCALAAGCTAEGGDGAHVPVPTGPVDAGPASDYASDGVYDRYGRRGFFVVREGPKLLAVSSTCTHRACPLKARSDKVLFCKCHGSTFTTEGKVTRGPAIRGLSVFPTSVDSLEHLIVDVQPLPPPTG